MVPRVYNKQLCHEKLLSFIFKIKKLKMIFGNRIYMFKITYFYDMIVIIFQSLILK